MIYIHSLTIKQGVILDVQWNVDNTLSMVVWGCITYQWHNGVLLGLADAFPERGLLKMGSALMGIKRDNGQDSGSLYRLQVTCKRSSATWGRSPRHHYWRKLCYNFLGINHECLSKRHTFRSWWVFDLFCQTFPLLLFGLLDASVHSVIYTSHFHFCVSVSCFSFHDLIKITSF